MAQALFRDPSARNWVFTLDNYTNDDENGLRYFANSDHVKYIVFGHETGENGTPHLQRNFQANGRLSFSRIQWLLDLPMVHLEIGKGSPEDNKNYCTKEDKDDYYEFDELSDCSSLGQRIDISKIINSMKNGATEEELVNEYSMDYLRGKRMFRDSIADAAVDRTKKHKKSKFCTLQLRPWQRECWYRLLQQDDRQIMFVVDEEWKNMACPVDGVSTPGLFTRTPPLTQT